MPEIKSYDGKKKHGHSDHNNHKGHKGHASSHAHNKKRRPHHDMEAADAHEEDEITLEASEINEQSADFAHDTGADDINTEAQNEGVYAPDDMTSEGGPTGEGATHKLHLEFYGSEIIREKAPKVMEFADTVADEWIKDGQFQDLPVENPLAKVYAGKALRKAKDVEKKLEEKGVFAMAKMGLEYVKSEFNKRKSH